MAAGAEEESIVSLDRPSDTEDPAPHVSWAWASDSEEKRRSDLVSSSRNCAEDLAIQFTTHSFIPHPLRNFSFLTVA